MTGVERLTAAARPAAHWRSRHRRPGAATDPRSQETRGPGVQIKPQPLKKRVMASVSLRSRHAVWAPAARSWSADSPPVATPTACAPPRSPVLTSWVLSPTTDVFVSSKIVPYRWAALRWAVQEHDRLPAAGVEVVHARAGQWLVMTDEPDRHEPSVPRQSVGPRRPVRRPARWPTKVAVRLVSAATRLSRPSTVDTRSSHGCMVRSLV